MQWQNLNQANWNRSENKAALFSSVPKYRPILFININYCMHFIHSIGHCTTTD